VGARALYRSLDCGGSSGSETLLTERLRADRRPLIL
jgi:hypothetical protein